MMPSKLESKILQRANFTHESVFPPAVAWSPSVLWLWPLAPPDGILIFLLNGCCKSLPLFSFPPPPPCSNLLGPKLAFINLFRVPWLCPKGKFPSQLNLVRKRIFKVEGRVFSNVTSSSLLTLCIFLKVD